MSFSRSQKMINYALKSFPEICHYFITFFGEEKI